MTEEKKVAYRKNDREARKISRMERDSEDLDNDRRDMQERMKKLREKKSKAEMNFNRIAKKHKMRERRYQRDGKNHLIDISELRKE